MEGKVWNHWKKTTKWKPDSKKWKTLSHKDFNWGNLKVEIEKQSIGGIVHFNTNLNQWFKSSL